MAMDTAVAEQEADTTAGYYGQDGGSNGSDGEDSDSFMGGKGSGLDIGTLNITRFILSLSWNSIIAMAEDAAGSW